MVWHRQRVSFPSGVLGGILREREEVLEHAAGGGVDLGVDLRAGDEAQLPALALEADATWKSCAREKLH
jgi:dihydropteroate synthase